jgi:hypothetical protein
VKEFGKDNVVNRQKAVGENKAKRHYYTKTACKELNKNHVGNFIMSRVLWKDNKVISIKLRNGVHVLTQMLKSPYLLVFNIFSDKDEWSGVELSNANLLFCTATTKQLFKHSEVVYHKNVSPLISPNLPTLWIKRNAAAYKTKIWEGTKDEMEFIMIGKGGGSLIEKNIYGVGLNTGGVIERELSYDSPYIDSCEMTGLAIYPLFNERLYLCYRLGRNVDPEKYLIFERPLDTEYKCYFEMISGKVGETGQIYLSGTVENGTE